VNSDITSSVSIISSQVTNNETFSSINTDQTVSSALRYVWQS
jgi:hypothetical protein